MKTYEGRILDVSDCVVTVEQGWRTVELKAGADVCRQAEALKGRKVRFQAQLHESTVHLASPIFVIGSGFGLQAVREAQGETRTSGVRNILAAE